MYNVLKYREPRWNNNKISIYQNRNETAPSRKVRQFNNDQYCNGGRMDFGKLREKSVKIGKTENIGATRVPSGQRRLPSESCSHYDNRY